MKGAGRLVGNFELYPKGDNLGVAQAFLTLKNFDYMNELKIYNFFTFLRVQS